MSSVIRKGIENKGKNNPFPCWLVCVQGPCRSEYLMSFLCGTEPNISLNEEVAEHDNVILVQASELERNNAEGEVVFGN